MLIVLIWTAGNEAETILKLELVSLVSTSSGQLGVTKNLLALVPP
jgi:NADH dehydrogenase FAD-containing subunit